LQAKVLEEFGEERIMDTRFLKLAVGGELALQ
jgi:hypothetical protein